MSNYQAFICDNCSFGNKKDNCSKCGNWASGTNRYPAILCSNCGFSKKDNCVICGNWLSSSRTPAFLCGNCGFSGSGKKCIKCGRY